MKVVFLDIDGVLNSRAWLEEGKREPMFGSSSRLTDGLDPEAIARLNNIVESTGALLVLSSSWRGLAPISSINRALVQQGLRRPLFGITPSIGNPRGMEIASWLEMAGGAVESFVILDDDSDMAHLGERLIQTSWETGLQDFHMDLAIATLGPSS